MQHAQLRRAESNGQQPQQQPPLRRCREGAVRHPQAFSSLPSPAATTTTTTPATTTTAAFQGCDSVPYMVRELRHLIEYVESKPALHDGSASFMRDYLRTLLIRTQVSPQDGAVGIGGGSGGAHNENARQPHLEIEAVEAEDGMVVEHMDASMNSEQQQQQQQQALSVVAVDPATEASGGGSVAVATAGAAQPSAPAGAAVLPQPQPQPLTLSTVLGNRPARVEDLPDDLLRKIFEFMNGWQLSDVRGVSRKWREFASDETLWKRLCLETWRALDSDERLWDYLLAHEGIEPHEFQREHRWRCIYPVISHIPQWTCRLQKTGRFICRLVAHQIDGQPLDEDAMPYVLIVERRFNISHLDAFVLPEAAIFYFEPEKKEDEEGYQGFIDYLIQRNRAGLALDDDRRIIFIPPCEYSQTTLRYGGSALLGVVQHAYPPLAS